MDKNKQIKKDAPTARSISRADFKVTRTVFSEITCGVLAVISTVLVWLFSAPI